MDSDEREIPTARIKKLRDRANEIRAAAAEIGDRRAREYDQHCKNLRQHSGFVGTHHGSKWVSKHRQAARLHRRDPGGLSLGRLIAGPMTSSLARCFEHGCFKRLARTGTGPGYKLERRVVLLTCFESGGEEHLALSTRCLGATGEHECMTKHD